jgi:pentatricopeptide repeat protein
MAAAGLEPTTMTYNLALKACFAFGSTVSREVVERALQLRQEMRQQGLRPDLVTYTSLIQLCGHALAPDQAIATFGEMEEEGVAPDQACLTALIQACGCLRPHQALSYFDRLVCPSSPSVRICNSRPAGLPTLCKSFSAGRAYLRNRGRVREREAERERNLPCVRGGPFFPWSLGVVVWSMPSVLGVWWSFHQPGLSIHKVCLKAPHPAFLMSALASSNGDPQRHL